MFSTQDPDTSMVESPRSTALDNEIANLQEQISQLKSQRALATSTILSSRSTLSTLSSLRKAQDSLSIPQNSPTSSPGTETSLLNPLLSTAKAQFSHNITNLYRALSSISTFHITDPDPNAVDEGHVLALRFDICVSNGKFQNAYHVMLNRPFKEEDGSEERKGLYRVHRHTLPACIPLTSISSRFLPNGKGVLNNGSTGREGARQQDLKAFTRSIRRELVSYHKRLSSIKALRKEFNLSSSSSSLLSKGKSPENVIIDITPADPEAKQMRIEWVDGRIGRVAMDEKGKVVKCVVIGEEGRDRDVERRVMSSMGNGKEARVEDVGTRLREGIH